MVIFINHTLFHSGHIFMTHMCVLFVSQFIVLIVPGIILQKKNILTMGILITVAGLVTLSPTHQMAELVMAFSILLGAVFGRYPNECALYTLCTFCVFALFLGTWVAESPKPRQFAMRRSVCV